MRGDVHETERDNHDANVAESVTEDMQKDATHVEILVRVAGGALRFRFRVIVTLVTRARVGAFAALGAARGLA